MAAPWLVTDLYPDAAFSHGFVNVYTLDITLGVGPLTYGFLWPNGDQWGNTYSPRGSVWTNTYSSPSSTWSNTYTSPGTAWTPAYTEPTYLG